MAVYPTAMLWYFTAQLAGESACALLNFSLFLNVIMDHKYVTTYLAHPIAGHASRWLGSCNLVATALCGIAAYSGDRRQQLLAARCMLPALVLFAADQVYNSFIHTPPEVAWGGYTAALTVGTVFQLAWCTINALDLGQSKKRQH